MQNFDPELKQEMFEATGFMCCSCTNNAEQMHHIVPNTKINRNRWKLYIQSPMNMFPLCSTCHLNKPLPNKPSERVLDIYEKYLQRLTGSAVNDPMWDV